MERGAKGGEGEGGSGKAYPVGWVSKLSAILPNAVAVARCDLPCVAHQPVRT